MKTKKAIKELEERLLIDDYKEQIPEYYEAIEAAIEALKNQTWIPCSEQMPPDEYDYQTIIFTSIDKEGNYFVEAGYYDKKYNQCVNESYFPGGFKFIAWMPLPEPYQEGEE